MKRLFDLLLSISGLLLLAPFFGAVVLWIKLDSPGPVFFRQVRVGQFGREFRIIKFRTMRMDAEQMGPQVSSEGDTRITPCGAFLRKYKIDELPQLINVIMGDMSLVGPRPEVPKYVAAYADDYRQILMIKPGITDYASIEYSNEGELLRDIDDPEKKYLEEILPAKIVLYRTYLANRGMVTDVALIWQTVRKICS